MDVIHEMESGECFQINKSLLHNTSPSPHYRYGAPFFSFSTLFFTYMPQSDPNAVQLLSPG